VLGDGPVGILCAWALQTVCDRVLLVGRHAEKLRRASWRGVYTVQGLPPGLPPADLVVEATGAPQGAADALRICRAEGTVVIKTTVAVPQPLQMNELVVKEITLLGSRCGRFEDGMAMLSAFPDMPVERLITDRFAPEQAPEAFGRAEAGSSLKVVMNFNEGTKRDASHGCGI
jgi:alcohol dehydrogenase